MAKRWTVTGDEYDHFYVKVGSEVVGELALEEIDEVFWMTQINVREEYQRQGIGTALIKAAVSAHGNKLFASNREKLNDEDSRHVTDDGAVLINACIKKNILPKTAWSDPTGDDTGWEDDDTYEGV